MRTIRAGVIALLLLTVAVCSSRFLASAEPVDGVTIHLDVRLQDNGILEVVQDLVVPDGDDFHMSIPLRVPTESGDRDFAVTDIESTGNATAAVTADRFTIDAAPGRSRISYNVAGAVENLPEGQAFRWLGILDTDIAELSATAVSGTYRLGIVNCLAGPVDSDVPCERAYVDPSGVMQFVHHDLRAGDRIDVTLSMPAGTVPVVDASSVTDSESTSGAFAVTAPVVIGFTVLAVVLLTVALYVLRARRRPAGALSSDAGQVGVVVHNAFASPGGLLPGQAGAVVDERATAAHLAATVVDLAVRGYLWIGRADDDWQLVRRNAADDRLRPYEKSVYDAVLASAESISVAALTPPSADLRRALENDAVAGGWLTDRRRHGVLFWFGAALVVAGAVALPILASTIGHALVGVAVIVAGIGLLLLPRLLPRRTARGDEMAGQIDRLTTYLRTAVRSRIAPADREMVFARSLPYAVALRTTSYWIPAFADLDPASLYWVGGFDGRGDLRDFAGAFPSCIAALERAFD